MNRFDVITVRAHSHVGMVAEMNKQIPNSARVLSIVCTSSSHDKDYFDIVFENMDWKPEPPTAPSGEKQETNN